MWERAGHPLFCKLSGQPAGDHRGSKGGRGELPVNLQVARFLASGHRSACYSSYGSETALEGRNWAELFVTSAVSEVKPQRNTLLIGNKTLCRPEAQKRVIDSTI